MPVLPSYRNQSIEMLCKSVDWFLYEGNTGIWWVNWMKDLKLKKWAFCIFALSNLFQMFYTVTLKNFIEISRKSSAMNFFVCKFSTLLRMVYCVFYEVFWNSFFPEPSWRLLFFTGDLWVITSNHFVRLSYFCIILITYLVIKIFQTNSTLHVFNLLRRCCYI